MSSCLGFLSVRGGGFVVGSKGLAGKRRGQLVGGDVRRGWRMMLDWILCAVVEYHQLTCKCRETLAKNVDIWMHLQKIFNTAIPSLEKWSLKSIDAADNVRSGHDVSESADLILKNYDALREDLHYLNNLLVISRNMLAIKDTAQEICAAVRFDRAVQKLVVLCVNVTSKGYDGETVDDTRRQKLNEITELCRFRFLLVRFWAGLGC